MNRRGFLALLAGGGIGAGGMALSSNDGNVDQAIDDVDNLTNGEFSGIIPESGEDKMTQEFGTFSPGFEKIEFQRVVASNFNGYLAKITFGAHSMDGFGIRHFSHDSVEKDIYVCTPPKSTGVREVPLPKLLREGDAVYPNRKFDLVGYEGEFSECGAPISIAISTGVKGKASFTLPEKVAPAPAFRDMSGEE